MIHVVPFDNLGRMNIDWLNSRFHFNFSGVAAPMGFGFGPLRVWNDDEIAAQSGNRIKTEINPGEGAFYGPKLEFHLRDSHGRAWQCGTIQLDFVLPERLGADYVASDGSRQRPVLIHHAVLGSMERFIGMLLEHHKGALPLWLAPEQIAVASVTSAQEGYARKAAAALGREGYRVSVDGRPERIGRKIAEAHDQGLPLLAIAGEREMERGTLTFRRRDGRQEELTLADAARRYREEAFR